MSIASASLHYYFQRFAAQKGRDTSKTWINLTYIMHRARPNWFTTYLSEIRVAAVIEPTVLQQIVSVTTQARSNIEVGVSVMSIPLDSPARVVRALRKRLLLFKREIDSLRREFKRFFQENRRLRDQ